MTSLSQLPEEVKVEILLHLDYVSLLRCRVCCRSLHITVSTSSALQYIIALGLNSMQDTGSGRAPSELLQRLRQHYTCWELLQWRRLGMIHVSGELHAYELVAGAFSKSDGNQISVVWLPNSNAMGREVILPSLGIAIRDFAIDPTRDLLVLLEDEIGYEVRLHFRTISSGRPHPDATKPFVPFRILPDALGINRFYSAEIQLGDNLLALFMHRRRSKFSARALVWNWRKGHILYDSDESNQFGILDNIHDFSLIGSDAFIITSRYKSGCIHICTLPDYPNQRAKSIATLELPQLVIGCTVSTFSVHSAPYHGKPTSTPFATCPDSRIHCFTVGYSQAQFMEVHSIKFNLFVHNRTFLSFIEQYNRGMRWTKWVPWGIWGPHSCRLLPEIVPQNWLRYVHGHRVACTSAFANGVDVLNFSTSPDTTPVSLYHRTFKKDNPTVVPRLNVFTKDVVTYLPYRLSTRPVDEDFYAYMIDEERLIGLKMNNMGSLELHVYAF